MIEEFGLEDLIQFFESLGMLVTEQNGYYYPASLQAATVVDTLTQKLKHLHVDILTEFEVTKAEKRKSTFYVYGNDKCFQSSNLILATGGCAQPNLGSNGSGYKLAKDFHHKITDTFPSLVGLEAEGKYLKDTSGVRNVSNVSVYANNELIAKEHGEVQFTKYGVSGIPIFQISHFAIEALRRKKKVKIYLNLMPQMVTLEETTEVFLNKKLVYAILLRLKIDPRKPVAQISRKDFNRILDMIQHFEVEIKGYKGYDMAQVTAGGVSTKEIIQGTLESKLLEGLYVVGELLDVDGTCGGYNLQWAFTSGYIAASQIGRQ